MEWDEAHVFILGRQHWASKCIVYVYVYVEAGEMAGWFHLDLLYLYNI